MSDIPYMELSLINLLFQKHFLNTKHDSNHFQLAKNETSYFANLKKYPNIYKYLLYAYTEDVNL